jgi:hypothetical protein
MEGQHNKVDPYPKEDWHVFENLDSNLNKIILSEERNATEQK